MLHATVAPHVRHTAPLNRRFHHRAPTTQHRHDLSDLPSSQSVLRMGLPQTHILTERVTYDPTPLNQMVNMKAVVLPPPNPTEAPGLQENCRGEWQMVLR